MGQLKTYLVTFNRAIAYGKIRFLKTHEKADDFKINLLNIEKVI